jgi:hypothetical protein
MLLQEATLSGTRYFAIVQPMPDRLWYWTGTGVVCLSPNLKEACLFADMSSALRVFSWILPRRLQELCRTQELAGDDVVKVGDPTSRNPR